MSKRCLVFVLFVVLAGLLSGISYADEQLTIGYSGNSSVHFTETAGNVGLSFTGNCGSDCISGYAYLDAIVGTYQLWITGGTPTISNDSVNGNGAVLHFAATLAGSQLLTTIALDSFQGDASHAPELLGNSTVVSRTGLFDSLWAVGQVDPFDMTVNLGNNPTVAWVAAANHRTTSGPISSGEIITSATPEPSSLALLGTGLVGLCGWLRRRG